MLFLLRITKTRVNPMNEKTPPRSLESLSPKDREKLTGLGGVLILVGFGLLLTLISNAYSIIQGPSGGMAPADWEYVKEHFSELAWLIRLEFVSNIILTVICAYLLYLYFHKKCSFTRCYIIVIIAAAVYTLLDLGAANYIAGQSGLKLELNEGKIIFGLIVRTLIWVPYMLKSWRVKLTFVN